MKAASFGPFGGNWSATCRSICWPGPDRAAKTPGAARRQRVCHRKGRKVAALPQLWDAQLQRAEPSVEGAVAIAVAPRGALAAALVAPGADHPLDITLHQQLQHRLGYRSQKIAVA